MNFSRYTFTLIAVFCLSLTANAQVKLAKAQSAPSLCTDYHKKACKFEKDDLYYEYNSQSKDALFRPGQTSKLIFTSYKGYDYRFTFAAEDKITGGGNLTFKVVDAKSKKVLFDSEEDGSMEFEFVCDSSINLSVEVSLPESSAESNSKVLYGCVGFLLESRETLDTGF